MAWIVFGAWCSALTLLAYGGAFSLPFFFDDLVHIPFVDEHTLSEIWRTAGRLAYYRPLSFTIWKLMFQVIGGHSQVAQHAVNLLLHGANGFLVGWLAGQLWTKGETEHKRSPLKWLRITLSASLFLLYPFSYQAVPWVGSLSHLLVTSLILSSLAAYLLMRQGGRRVWGVVSLGLALLAPFAHENGALVGPLLAAILFTRPNYRRYLARDVGQVVLWTLPALLWSPIWWFAPKAIGGSVSVGNSETLLQNSAYVVQGIAYPLTWLGGWLRDWTGINDMVVTAILGVSALAGAALILRLSGADRRSSLTWLWCALASLPMTLFLSFNYVINGPRLLMLASVGAAWLWTDVAIQVVDRLRSSQYDSKKRQWSRVGPVVGFCLLLLAQNYTFLSRRMALHQILGSTHRQATSLTIEANQAGEESILVNLPAWIAPGEFTYALGHEGVQFLPDYVPPENLVSINSGRSASLVLIRNEAIRSEMPYFYSIAGRSGDWNSLAGKPGRAFVADYSQEQVIFRPAGRLNLSLSDVEPIARFRDPDRPIHITLLDAGVAEREQELAVELTWQVIEPPPEHITIFVHILNEEGKIAAQIDGDPIAGSYPLSQWAPGSIAQEWRFTDLEGGKATVLAGLYDRLTGQRIPAARMTNESWPDDAVMIGEFER